MPVFFNGRLLITPTSATKVDDSAMANRNLTVGNNILLIGSSLGGTPQKPLRFGDPNEAIALLRGGDLLDAVKKAFDPSNQTGGPAVVTVIRVDPAAGSEIVLQNDDDDSPVPGVKVVSVDAGEHTTNIQVRVEEGSVAGTVRITVRFGNDYCGPSPDISTVEEAVAWFNGSAFQFVKAELLSGATGNLAIRPYTSLTGGTNGTTSVGDWADAFQIAQTVDAQWITPVTGDPAVHAMCDAHVAFMSDQGRKERRANCGTVASTSDEDAATAAFSLNSDRTSLCHIGFYDYDENGELKLFPPYVTAAGLSGMFAGVNPGTALTNKTFKCRGLERELRNPTDTDVLIQAGVLCLETTEQGYKVVQSISTWRQNRNYNRVEISCGAALDQVVRNVREALDVLRGEKGNPLLLSRAVSITESTLRECAREEPQGPGLLAGNEESPPYRGIRASLEGDVLRVQFECSPVIPVNYVLTNVFAVPFSGTAVAI